MKCQNADLMKVVEAEHVKAIIESDAHNQKIFASIQAAVNKGKKPDTVLLKQLIARIYKRLLPISIMGDELFFYNSKYRIHIKVEKKELERQIFSVLGMIDTCLLTYVRNEQIKEVARMLLLDETFYLGSYKVNRERREYLNSKNGLFEIVGASIREVKLSKEEYRRLKLTYCLNVNVNVDTVNAWMSKPQTTIFDTLCKKAFNGVWIEKKQQLLLLIGLSITDCWDNKSFAGFLVGASNSGKSSILRFVHRLYTDLSDVSVVSNLDLYQIEKSGGLRDLNHAKINICYDMDQRSIRDVAHFKSVVSREPFVAFENGRNTYIVDSNATLLMAANALPEILDQDESTGFKRRVFLVHFPKTVTGDDVLDKLDQMLWEEREAIITVALQSVCRFLVNKKQLTMLEDDITYLETYEIDANSFTDFYEKHLLKLPNEVKSSNIPIIDYITLFDLLKEYDLFIERNRKMKVNEEVCKKVMQKHGFSLNIVDYTSDGEPLYGYKDIVYAKCLTCTEEAYLDYVRKYLKCQRDGLRSAPENWEHEAREAAKNTYKYHLSQIANNR